ncbi:MAG: ABC transporter permease [Acidimicrobiia bacterium]|nr:ABC transporter permease [Acidimicrobiia bacterium]
MSIESLEQARVVSARSKLIHQLVDLWRSRALLALFVRTELKVKYKNSVLGFAWSMLNPALYLIVFYIVFQIILGSGIPDFAIFLLSGLLVWNLFAAALGAGTISVVEAAAIVKKVSFPRSVLPLASVGAGLMHFVFQSVVLVAALVVFQHSVGWRYLWLLPLAMAALLVLASTLAVFLSAVNVTLRDTAHFVELAVLAWFWITPIVYPFRLVADRASPLVQVWLLNPMIWVVIAFQRAIYDQAVAVKTTDGTKSVTKILPVDVTGWWYAWHLLIVLAVSIVLFLAALAYFGHREGDFSEEL